MKTQTNSRVQGGEYLTHRRSLIATVAVVLATLAGCATPLDARRDAEYQAKASVMDRPVVRPVRSISSFSESLLCMDHMLRAAELPTTLIASKQLPDYSGKVPAATKEMIITSLSQMSRLSNAFRYVDYEVDIARQDTVQNLTTILLNNNQMQLQRPALYVSGAVAFVDQGVISNNLALGTAASRLDTGYSRSRNATIIALEMHLGDFRTRTLIPGMDSANEVIVGGAGEGLDLAGRIGNYGVKFNVGRDYALGTGGALRTLVDLAMIELVGKWARVPYWQCLMLDQTNPNFQRQMHDWYEASGAQGQLRLIQSSLVHQGYLPASSQPLAVNHPQLRDALSRFQADAGIVVTGVPDFPTYERALRNFVTLNEDGSLQRIGWTNTGAITTALSDTQTSVASWPAARPWMIDMQIENPQPATERAPFQQGEQVFLSATVSRASHLYCFFADAKGSVMRLLPNGMQTQTLVSANQAVRIPDWMSPNPGFILDAGNPGVESVMCVATAEDASPKLGADLQQPALAQLKSVRTLDEIHKLFATALGADRVVAQMIQWTVVPRRSEAEPAAK